MGIWMCILGLTIFIIGTILSLIISDGHILALLCIMLISSGCILFTSGVLENNNTSILFNTDIEYKYIEKQNYYCIEYDGDIYKITQENWVNLDVPIINCN